MPPDPCDPTLHVLAERIQGLSDRLTEYQSVQLRELRGAREATDLARSEMERRLSEMNEFRAQLASERMTYVSRDMLDARLGSAMAEVRSNAMRISQLEQDRANLQGRVWAGGVFFTIVVTLLNIALRFIIK